MTVSEYGARHLLRLAAISPHARPDRCRAWFSARQRRPFSGQTTPDEIKRIVEVSTDINFIVGNDLASDEPPKGAKQMDAKATMYGAVFAINSGFDSILTALQTLHGQEAISADYMQEQMEIAEELRAGINTTVTGNRHRTEAEDWHRFGKLRATTQKRLKGEEPNGNLPPTGTQ